MWVAQLRGKYLSSGSFLSPPPLPILLSPGFGKVSFPLNLLLLHVFVTKFISFPLLSIWNSAWVPTLPNFIPFPTHNISFLPNLVVLDLILPNSTWNLPLILSLFDTQSFKEIQKIIINPSSSSKFLWTPSSNGLFSSSSAYHSISSPRVSVSSSPLEPKFWKLLWKLKLNAKLKLFLWKIAWDIVRTKVRPSAILHIPPSNSPCPLCNSEADSLHHLFFHCIFAKVAWRHSFWPLDSSTWDSLSLPNWINGITLPYLTFGIPKSDSHLFQIFVVVLCDLLWFNRNKVFHGGSIPNITKLAESINKNALAHLLLRSPLASWNMLLGFPIPKVPSRLILTLQLESIFLLKLQSARTIQGESSELFLKSVPLVIRIMGKLLLLN